MRIENRRVGKSEKQLVESERISFCFPFGRDADGEQTGRITKLIVLY